MTSAGGGHQVLKAPASVRRTAPMLGELSRDVLTEFGYGAAEIDGFIADGIIEEARVPVEG